MERPIDLLQTAEDLVRVSDGHEPGDVRGRDLGESRLDDLVSLPIALLRGEHREHETARVARLELRRRAVREDRRLGAVTYGLLGLGLRLGRGSRGLAVVLVSGLELSERESAPGERLLDVRIARVLGQAEELAELLRIHAVLPFGCLLRGDTRHLG